MNDMERQATIEDQLWLELQSSEARVDRLCSRARDKVVRVLQYGVRERRETSEAGDELVGWYRNLQ